MQNIKPFDAISLEEISKILGEEVSGSELTRLFLQINVKDDSSETKWKRINSALSACQQRDNSACRIISLIQIILNPVRYAKPEKKEQYEKALNSINIILSFSGYRIEKNGELVQIKPVKNIDEALLRAQNFYKLLVDRKIHPEVMKYCKPEALQDNYFHAVFEAIKGLNARIKAMSGLDIDGTNLINTAFSEQKPYLVINTMQTQSEKDEHNGFRFLILGVQTMFRNPISHEAKINWEISGQDGLDILTTISLIHRKLDLAVRIYPNHP